MCCAVRDCYMVTNEKCGEFFGLFFFSLKKKTKKKLILTCTLVKSNTPLFDRRSQQKVIMIITIPRKKE